MEIKKIEEGILYLLQGTSPTGDGSGYTFLEIREFLESNNIQGYFEEEKYSWKKLKDLLEKMEEKELIEERHFGEILGGRVDFSIEQKVSELIEKKQKELKEKWKI